MQEDARCVENSIVSIAFIQATITVLGCKRGKVNHNSLTCARSARKKLKQENIADREER
jgi:hypothetical protein